jgi:hypothetical protein
MADFWCEQLTKAKEQIALLDSAIQFLLTNPHQSYTLDTGQGTQQVRRPDLDGLQNQYDSLLNRISTLEIRCNPGSASQQIRPGW